jgi:hypothetical protein
VIVADDRGDIGRRLCSEEQQARESCYTQHDDEDDDLVYIKIALLWA